MTSNSRRAFATVALVVALAGSVGCGSGPRLRPVSGSVTFNGQPVLDGDITFVPENTALGPTQGRIKDGRYEAKAAEGKNSVRVTASKIRPGGAKGAGGEPVPEDYIPAKFNANSKLTATVTDGPNQFDFALDSTGN